MIVGIDTGARRLAICELHEDGDPPVFHHYETLETSHADALRDLQWWLARRSRRWYGDTHVYLEKVVKPHGNAERSFDGIMAHCMTIGMVVSTVGGELITPSTWKAAILGHGHADKDDTELWLEHSAPEVAEVVQACSPSRADRRSDLRDAFCIAAYGDLARRHPLQLEQGRSVSRRKAKRGA
jgi:hypothetical protein